MDAAISKRSSFISTTITKQPFYTELRMQGSHNASPDNDWASPNCFDLLFPTMDDTGDRFWSTEYPPAVLHWYRGTHCRDCHHTSSPKSLHLGTYGWPLRTCAVLKFWQLCSSCVLRNNAGTTKETDTPTITLCPAPSRALHILFRLPRFVLPPSCPPISRIISIDTLL